MRTKSKLAMGGSLLTAGAVVAGLAATTLVVTDPLAPKASADSLSRFEGCDALLDWYVGNGVKEIGPYGWEGPVWAVDMPTAALAESADAGAGVDAARASSDTGTNTQEADVDEPDVAKTDGRIVVRLVDQRVLVVEDVTGDEPRELGRLPLPVDTYGQELLLVGDHVLVAQDGGWGGPMPMELGDDTSSRIAGPAGGTRITDIDISDPADPRIVDDRSFSGRQVSVRRYGDTVRLVTTTERPQLAWVMPEKGISEREATRRNRALVRATTIEDWLPSTTDEQTRGSREPLVDCDQVFHPPTWAGGATTVVTTWDVEDPEAQQSVGVTADGTVVYSSADRLYVASSDWGPVGPWRGIAERMGGASLLPPRDPRTRLHAFALEGTSTTYVASGHVDGTVRDRWSLDEHDGRLRVAWTESGRRGRTQNGITVLAERDGALVPTGTIDRLGVDEQIQSVRWFDDLAVLVTFRQVDPLYTIDLTDQDRPRELGQLKIPGYSGYLHPIGDDLLLGLGVDATLQGENLGSQAAVFDVRDLRNPKRVAQQGFGRESSITALDDPRAFTWLPEVRTGLTTVASWTSERTRLVALEVSPTGSLAARDLLTDVGWNARTLPLDDGRVAVVDEDGVRLLRIG